MHVLCQWLSTLTFLRDKHDSVMLENDLPRFGEKRQLREMRLNTRKAISGVHTWSMTAVHSKSNQWSAHLVNEDCTQVKQSMECTTDQWGLYTVKAISGVHTWSMTAVHR